MAVRPGDVDPVGVVDQPVPHRGRVSTAPGGSEVVRRALSGIRRIRATPPVRRAPLLLEDIRTLLTSIEQTAASWPAGVSARRDAALLLMGFAGASRRSELVALTLADVTLHKTGRAARPVAVVEDRPGSPGAGEGVAVRPRPATCPPCAYVRWRQVLSAWDTAPDGQGRRAVMSVLRRQAAATSIRAADGEEDGDGGGAACVPHRPAARTRGPRRGCCSRRCTRPGPSAPGPMTGHAVNEMIRRRADQAGFTPAQTQQLGGHSLRSGFVTEAFRAGADAHSIMRQTGHKSPAMLEVYAREHAPLVGNAVTRLGL